MIDPILQFDPFDPPARPRACPRPGCVAGGGGRLFVETINASLRNVWCDECDWHQIYNAAGPVAAVEAHDPKPTPRQWNTHGMPKHRKDLPMPERRTKECPSCKAQVKMLRRQTGKCYACSDKEEQFGRLKAEAIDMPQFNPGAYPTRGRPKKTTTDQPTGSGPALGVPAPANLPKIDHLQTLANSVNALRKERDEALERVNQINQALAEFARSCETEAP